MNAGPTDSGWYYSKLGAPTGQQYGPLAWEQLVAYARSGVLVPDDLVWGPQLANWQPAAQIPGLFASLPPSPPPPSYQQDPYAYGAVPPKPRSRLLYWLIPLIAVIVIGGGLGAYFAIWYGVKDDLTNLTDFVQQEGEIFLEPSGTAGPDSFAGEQFVAVGASTTLSIPNPAITLPPVTSTTLPATSTSQTQTTTTTGAPQVVVASYTGDTPALYGGSKSKLISDKEAELQFLERNPQKAAAFCEALNSDPTLRWSGGNQVRPDQLRDYFAELTPMMLTRDTRVTNYGYRNGHPTPRQSVLQAGQLVLVDRYGVPRKRCECGNPLTPPKPSRKTPTYTGPRWPGFDPTTIIVIQQTTIIIDIFVVIDINTGQPFGRPAGTSGSNDGAPGVITTSTTMTSEPPSTDTTTTTTTGSTEPIAGSELNGLWSGTYTVTDLNIPDDVAQGAEEQGCSLADLQAMLGKALPMTMNITVDPGGQSGTAVMKIDVSSLNTGTSDDVSSEPQTIPFTIHGNTLTFSVEDSQAPTAMTGTVARQGQTLGMTGTMSMGESGIGMSAEWQVTKQIGI